MKHLNVAVTDEQFERLERGKGDRSWRDALLDELAEDQEEQHGSTA